MDFFKSAVSAQTEIARGVFLLRLQAPGQQIDPGQFYLLRGWEDTSLPLLRPISVYRYRGEELEFLYRVVGKGTAALSRRTRGEEVELLGPLGNGFPWAQVEGKVALVGGGVGIPPLYETARRIRARGHAVDLYLGYGGDPFLAEDFAAVCDHLFIASENGSKGHRGYITDLVDPGKYDALFTCGPEAMMFQLLGKKGADPSKTWLSLEKRMGCGIGACLTCNCATKQGMKRCCSDGPVFRGDELLRKEGSGYGS